MLDVEERVDLLEVTFNHFMIQTERIIAEMRNAAEKDRRTWNVRFEQDQQAWKAQLEEEKKLWNDRFEQDQQVREEEQKRWNDRFEQDQQAREEEQKRWNDRFEQDQQAWTDQMEQERQAREEEQKRWNDRFEQDQRAWIDQMEQEQKRWDERFEQDQQAWKAELKEEQKRWNERFEQDQQAWKAELKEEQKRWNERWGEIANSMGRLVEDIVAPNIPRIARTYFGFTDIDDFMVRRKVRAKHDRSKRREFDVIAVCEDKVLINETKTTPRIDYIDKFLEALTQIEEYFPEYKEKTIIPVFASLYIGEDIVRYLTKHRLYAMALGDEMMDILNFDQLKTSEAS